GMIMHFNKDDSIVVNDDKNIVMDEADNTVSDNNAVFQDQDNPQDELESYFRAVPYNIDEYLSDEEFVIAGGVRMGMTFEEVVEIICDDFEVIENAPGVKSILKDGYHFGFYQIDGTFENQTDLPIDGIFRLLDVSLNEYSHDEFPRGIKIGDSIEDVLSKFPGQDKTLRKWEHQMIYGKDEIGQSRAILSFHMFNECYMFRAMTGEQVLIVNFDRNNQVRSLEIHKEAF
ncbi:MAG: hypothetical protein GX790_03625, partial [Syntrophomonadaceae bacterium]|nr:hypothetical protein [Syntrophomonadaceae bacterium]